MECNLEQGWKENVFFMRKCEISCIFFLSGTKWVRVLLKLRVRRWKVELGLLHPVPTTHKKQHGFLNFFFFLSEIQLTVLYRVPTKLPSQYFLAMKPTPMYYIRCSMLFNTCKRNPLTVKLQHWIADIRSCSVTNKQFWSSLCV